MEKKELDLYLEFVRSSINELDEKIKTLDNGDWSKNVRNDYDKEILYSMLANIRSMYRSLLTRNFECEN